MWLYYKGRKASSQWSNFPHYKTFLKRTNQNQKQATERKQLSKAEINEFEKEEIRKNQCEQKLIIWKRTRKWFKTIAINQEKWNKLPVSGKTYTVLYIH